jgi:hypothetical protein
MVLFVVIIEASSMVPNESIWHQFSQWPRASSLINDDLNKRVTSITRIVLLSVTPLVWLEGNHVPMVEYDASNLTGGPRNQWIYNRDIPPQYTPAILVKNESIRYRFKWHLWRRGRHPIWISEYNHIPHGANLDDICTQLKTIQRMEQQQSGNNEDVSLDGIREALEKIGRRRVAAAKTANQSSTPLIYSNLPLHEKIREKKITTIQSIGYGGMTLLYGTKDFKALLWSPRGVTISNEARIDPQMVAVNNWRGSLHNIELRSYLDLPGMLRAGTDLPGSVKSALRYIKNGVIMVLPSSTQVAVPTGRSIADAEEDPYFSIPLTVIDEARSYHIEPVSNGGNTAAQFNNVIINRHGQLVTTSNKRLRSPTITIYEIERAMTWRDTEPKQLLKEIHTITVTSALTWYRLLYFLPFILSSSLVTVQR